MRDGGVTLTGQHATLFAGAACMLVGSAVSADINLEYRPADDAVEVRRGSSKAPIPTGPLACA
jgi:hypothetical protein